MSIPIISFEHELRLKVGGEYHFRLPDNYDSDLRRWPLLIYLHGMGGQDEILDSDGPHNLIERADDNFILCMPKCSEARWQADVILGLIQQLISEHRIDLSRLYLTGVSIGGLATWELALRRPSLFAASPTMRSRAALECV
jgi:predicted peptidase